MSQEGEASIRFHRLPLLFTVRSQRCRLQPNHVFALQMPFCFAVECQTVVFLAAREIILLGRWGSFPLVYTLSFCAAVPASKGGELFVVLSVVACCFLCRLLLHSLLLHWCEQQESPGCCSPLPLLPCLSVGWCWVGRLKMFFCWCFIQIPKLLPHRIAACTRTMGNVHKQINCQTIGTK